MNTKKKEELDKIIEEENLNKDQTMNTRKESRKIKYNGCIRRRFPRKGMKML